LTTHWSDRDLAHLPPEQREAQELEMASVYETFDDEKGLDAALASTEPAVPAEAEPSDEPTPEEHEQIVIQVRRTLSMRATKHRSGTQAGTEEPKVPAAAPSANVARLLSVQARYGFRFRWHCGLNARQRRIQSLFVEGLVHPRHFQLLCLSLFVRQVRKVSVTPVCRQSSDLLLPGLILCIDRFTS
jgi:hypothetical protein